MVQGINITSGHIQLLLALKPPGTGAHLINNFLTGCGNASVSDAIPGGGDGNFLTVYKQDPEELSRFFNNFITSGNSKLPQPFQSFIKGINTNWIPEELHSRVTFCQLLGGLVAFDNRGCIYPSLNNFHNDILKEAREMPDSFINKSHTLLGQFCLIERKIFTI